MRDFPRPRRRTTALIAIVVVLVGGGAAVATPIKSQSATAEYWVQTAADSAGYDATAHLLLVASTGPRERLVTEESERDLVAIADSVAAERPDGSAAAEAVRCREALADLWWPEAKRLTEASCDQLDSEALAYARMDVLTYYAMAIEQSCPGVGRGNDPEAFPMAEHFPYRTPSIESRLAVIDRRLTATSPACVADRKETTP